MNQLDRWNKELERLEIVNFRSTVIEVDEFYKKALKEMRKEIKAYLDNYENLSFSKKLEVEHQIELAKKMDDIVSWLNDDVNKITRKHIEKEIERGYYGTFYALEGNENIQLDFTMLNEDYIKKIVDKPIDGATFSKRLYDYQMTLASKATDALLMGAAQGQGYRVVAKNIAELTEASFKQALRIARTEGGRAQSKATQSAYRSAARKGIELEKMWMATLDKRTRHSHAALDGQTVPVREMFEFGGHYAEGPRLFGVAALDINCRCTTIAVVNGMTPELRKDNETKEIKDYKNYQQWYNERVKEAGRKMGINEQISSKLSESQLSFYTDLLKGAPKAERDLWAKYQDDLKLNLNLTESEDAYYRAGHGVTMNVNSDIKGNFYTKPGNVFFHEFGHHLDYSTYDGKNMYSSIKHTVSNGKTLGETVKSEVRRMINTKTGKAFEKKLALLEDLKADFNKDKTVMGSISDLYGGATNNQLSVGVGHSNNYWKPPKSKLFKVDGKQYKNERLGKEAFAEMFAASVMDPNEVAMFKKWLPESYDMYKELVDKMLKGG